MKKVHEMKLYDIPYEKFFNAYMFKVSDILGNIRLTSSEKSMWLKKIFPIDRKNLP